jgi:putative ubiquitin-RnfH superfamily antitoxin RatB of RatAB toxin-antitoxin module
MVKPKHMSISVAYATPEIQKVIELEVPRGCTIQEAINQSGMLTLFPEIDFSKQGIGIFSRPKKLNDVVQPSDRIEIYRPLLIDPKEARRARSNYKVK